MDDLARAQIAALTRRVEDLERSLRMITEHIGPEATTPGASPEVDPEVSAALRAGRVVQAIKVYADRNEVDLVTAKAAVERIHAQGNY